MRPFVNWSGVLRSVPNKWIAPWGEAQVADLFVRARAEGRRVKVVGSGHSWSDIAVPVDIAVELSGMRGVLSVDESADPPTITVLGGTRLFEITEALEARGLAMPILGSIAQQTVAGAIATGTHGSSRAHGNLASLVKAMRIVTPSGEILDLDEQDPRLAGACVHLGALGIVTRVTLRVTRAFNLVEEREPLAIGEVVRDLDSISRSAEFVKLWWLPSTGKAVIYRYERTARHGSHSPLLHFLDEVVVNRTLFDLMLRGVRYLPAATAAINATVAATYLRKGSRVARSDRAFNLAMPPAHREAEWAFSMERGQQALDELVRVVMRRRLRINFPCEIRFVKGDNIWMSPDYGDDSCHIGVYQAESPDLRAYFDEADRIAKRLEGRPHWGKEFDWPRSAIEPVFPRMKEFDALVGAADPDGTLQNAFLERVLGPRPKREDRNESTHAA